MAAKQQEPASGSSSSRHGGHKKRPSPGEPTAAARLRVDVPSVQAAEEWQRTFDAVSDPLTLMDTQHRIVRANKAMADRLGLAKDQCVGQTCYRLVHGADEPPSFCPHARLLQDGEEHTVEVHEERLAGDFFVSVFPLRDSTGCLVGSVHVAHDITEKKRAEKVLRDSEARYRSLVETAQEGIGIVDLDENIIFVNQAYADLLGYRKEELLGLNLRELADEAEFAKYREETRQRREGKSSRYETMLRHKTGGPRYFSVSASPLFDDRGDFIGTIGLLTDITERKRANEALRNSEQRFRDLAELLPQTVYELDLEGRLTFVNRQALETFGYAQAELEAGVSCFQMLASQEHDRARHNIQRILDGQDLGGTEYTAQRKDGTQFPVIIYSSPILRDQVPAGLRGIVFDVTESKRAEEVLQKSEQRFRALIEHSHDAVTMIAADGTVLYDSPSVTRVLGYASTERLGRKVFEFVHPDERQSMALGFAKFVQQPGSTMEYQGRFLRKDGKPGWIEGLRSNLLHEPSVQAIVVNYRDVTDRKHTEEALRESQRRQAEAERLAAVGRMAARVAHEINNPLAGIRNSFRLVRDAVPAEHPDHDMVERIEREIDRISHIVRQMYTLYSPRSEKIADFVIADAIRDVLLTLEPIRREHEVQFEESCTPPGLTIRITEGGLHQILYNLTANATEASPRGGIVTVAAKLADDNNHEHELVEITVRDQGGGIPAEIQPRIFEPFFTAKSGDDSGKGLGLGLSVVRNIVEAHGGSIALESTPGQGTVFRVFLPHNPKEKE